MTYRASSLLQSSQSSTSVKRKGRPDSFPSRWKVPSTPAKALDSWTANVRAFGCLGGGTAGLLTQGGHPPLSPGTQALRAACGPSRPWAGLLRWAQGPGVRVWDVTSPWGREGCCAAWERLFQPRGGPEAGTQLREGGAGAGRRGVDAVGAAEQQSAVGPRGCYDPIDTPDGGGAVPLSQDHGACTKTPLSGQRKIRNGSDEPNHFRSFNGSISWGPPSTLPH